MKQMLILTAMVLVFGGAQAAETAVAGQQQTSTNNVQSGSQSAATGNNGTVQAIINQASIPAETTANVNQTVSGGTDSTVHQSFGTQKIKNTPSVNGAPLVSSNDTCMGSASGAVNVPGFGLGIGKTYTDDNCVMLKNSRELWNMGMKAAAMALMCTDSKNREALELTGFVCPQTERDSARRNQVNSVQASGEPTDPIVRNRLGLAPLAQ